MSDEYTLQPEADRIHEIHEEIKRLRAEKDALLEEVARKIAILFDAEIIADLLTDTPPPHPLGL